MRIGILVALFALLFITTSAYAANSLASCPYVGSAGLTTLPDIPQEGIALAALALTISFDVVAIGYMIARAFPHLGLRQWLQNEYWEIAKSAMLIAGIYGVMIFLSSLAYSIQPVQAGGPIGTGTLNIALNGMLYNSESYLCGVNDYLQGTWNLVGDMFLGIGFMKSLVIGYYTPIPIPIPAGGGFGFTFGVEYGPFQNLMLDTGNFLVAFYQSIINDYIQFLLFPTTLTTLAQILLIQPIMAIGLTFFIPFGLILRAFPFVRGVGGTLIAIGIGFALVYPAVLTLFNAPVTLIMEQDIPLPQWPVCGVGGGGAGAGCSTAPACTIPVVSGIPFAGAVTGFFCHQILNTFELVDSYGWGISFGFHVFGPISYFVNYMVNYGIYEIIQLLLFVLDLLIIYSVTDSIARSLGGSIRLELGGKLKLAT